MPLEIHPLTKNSNDFHAIFYENVKIKCLYIEPSPQVPE